jgi:hypothetical protein
MALDIKIGIINEKSKLVIGDVTGDYNAVSNPTGWIPATPRTFSSGVNIATDTLTYNNHGFYMGQVLTYTFTGTGMASVSSGDELYANVVDANNLKFALYPTNPGLIPVLDLNNATLANNALTPYNDTRARVSAISLSITEPGQTVALSPINLFTTTYWISPDYAYDLTSSVTLTDGVWKFVTTYTIDGSPYVVTKYALRDNTLKCLIGQLALGDMDTNSFEEVKLMYDKMVQVFECGDYVLAQSIYEDIMDILNDCDTTIFRNCGC